VDKTPLYAGQKVLWVRRFGKEIFPQGIGTVRTPGAVVYVDFDPPIEDASHPGNFIREGQDRPSKYMGEEDVRARFLCHECDGAGCKTCGGTGGSYAEFPLVKLFLGME